MGNHFFDEYGPWKPFPEPLPPPIVDPRTDPLLILKFNEAWRPYIVGCLSSLARPETYEDVLDEFIREDIDNGGQLPWLIEPYPVIDFFNWRFIQDPGQSGDTVTPTIFQHFAPGIDGQWATTFYCVNPCTECENYHQTSGIGQQNYDPFTVGMGGHITSMYGVLFSTVVGNAWTVEHEDCLGGVVIDSFGGQSFEITDFDMKRFVVGALGSFYLSINFDSDWSCGPA